MNFYLILIICFLIIIIDIYILGVFSLNKKEVIYDNDEENS